MCVAEIQLSTINPVVDAAAVSRGLKEAASECASTLKPAAAARMLIAAAVIDGLLARVTAQPGLLEACEQAEYWLAEEYRQNTIAIKPNEILRVLRAAIVAAT